MSVTILDSAKIQDILNLPFKSNLLRNSPAPEILDAKGNPFEPKTGKIREVVANRMMCDMRHVQLHAELPFTVTYRILGDEPIEKLLVSTYTSSTDFGYGRYEVYLSDNREDLYSDDNYIAEYDRRGAFNPKDIYSGTAQIFTLNEPKKAKYFGIKFTHGCILDGVVRLDFAGVFSAYAKETQDNLFVKGADLLESAVFTVDGDNATYTFSNVLKVDFLAVRDENSVVEVSLDGTEFKSIVPEYTKKVIGSNTYYLSETVFEAKAIRSKAGNIVGANSLKTEITVKKDNVITTDFVGVGTNVLPFQLMPESTDKFGYDPEFIKIEHKAIRELAPKIIRVWFQNDWFQLGPDKYDFNSIKMQQFMEYMDVFRELGTEIEIDFSFAVGRSLHSWYTIPEIPDQGRSAPRDTEQFARAVVACLRFLCDEKGYNIKYITVSNEPENANFAVTADNNIELKKKHYAKTLKDIDSELKKAGMRDRFEIWGPEDSATTKERDWLADMYNLAGDVIDCYTKHSYVATNDELLNINVPFHLESTKNSRVGLTEFGCHMPTYRKSTVGNLISAVNGGVCVTLHWCLANSVLTDPFCGPFDEEICLYRNDDFKNTLCIDPICAEYGPAMKYVPAHCRVIKNVSSNGFDARAAVFEKDGDVTIVAETNGSGERLLEINLNGITDKPIYRISYNIGERQYPTQIIVQQEKIDVQNGIIKENLTADHMMYLYTTIKG